MVGGGLRDLCDWWLKVRHHEDRVAASFSDERCYQFHHCILPKMAMEVGLLRGVRFRPNWPSSKENDRKELAVGGRSISRVDARSSNTFVIVSGSPISLCSFPSMVAKRSIVNGEDRYRLG